MKGQRLHSKAKIEKALALLCMGHLIGEVSTALEIDKLTLRKVMFSKLRASDIALPPLVRLYVARYSDLRWKTFIKQQGIKKPSSLGVGAKLNKYCKNCMYFDRGECMQLNPRVYKDLTVEPMDRPCDMWRPAERYARREFR